VAQARDCERKVFSCSVEIEMITVQLDSSGDGKLRCSHWLAAGSRGKDAMSDRLGEGLSRFGRLGNSMGTCCLLTRPRYWRTDEQRLWSVFTDGLVQARGEAVLRLREGTPAWGKEKIAQLLPKEMGPSRRRSFQRPPVTYSLFEEHRAWPRTFAYSKPHSFRYGLRLRRCAHRPRQARPASADSSRGPLDLAGLWLRWSWD